MPDDEPVTSTVTTPEGVVAERGRLAVGDGHGASVGPPCLRFSSMRLVSLVEDDGVPRTGVVAGEEVVDLTDPLIGLPGDMVGLLTLGADAADALRRASTTGARRQPLSTAPLTAPVRRPPSFLAIARNYDAHIAELGHQRPNSRPGSPSSPPV